MSTHGSTRIYVEGENAKKVKLFLKSIFDRNTYDCNRKKTILTTDKYTCTASPKAIYDEDKETIIDYLWDNIKLNLESTDMGHLGWTYDILYKEENDLLSIEASFIDANIVDWLVNELSEEGKGDYYWAEWSEASQFGETNDEEGKYFVNKAYEFRVGKDGYPLEDDAPKQEGEDVDCIWCVEEMERVIQIVPKGIKVLYVHGYGSNENSTTSQNIRQMSSFEVHTITYNPAEPIAAIQAIKQYADEHQIQVIIGSSLGAFMVMNCHGYLRIAINPCFKPSVELPKIDYAGPIDQYQALEQGLAQSVTPEDRNLCYGCFAAKDELLGTQYKAAFDSHFSQSVLIPGQHHVSKEALRLIINDIIPSLITNSK